MDSILIRVAYRFYTSSLAGIGIGMAPRGRYYGMVSVLLCMSFFAYFFGRNTFWRFRGNSFFENLAGIHFVPQKEGKVHKRGPKPPPFLWEKGAPANFKIPKIPTGFSFGIGMVYTKKIPEGSYRNTESVCNSNIDVLKHCVHVEYGCGKQFEIAVTLNHDVMTSFWLHKWPRTPKSEPSTGI